MTRPLKIGDRVRDKFKLAKPGDECRSGRIVRIVGLMGDYIVVHWDDGTENQISAYVLERLPKGGRR